MKSLWPLQAEGVTWWRNSAVQHVACKPSTVQFLCVWDSKASKLLLHGMFNDSALYFNWQFTLRHTSPSQHLQCELRRVTETLYECGHNYGYTSLMDTCILASLSAVTDESRLWNTYR